MFGFHRALKTSTASLARSGLIPTLSAILLFFPAQWVQAESVNATIRKGIDNYHQNEFEQAESNFFQATEELPDNPKLNYNLGNSRYKTGKFQEALQTYTQAMADDTPSKIKQNSLFNSGNTLFRLGKLEESAAAYKKVLEMNPRDMDAKFNLEFVREQLKKKEENQQKQKNQNKPSDSNSEGDKDQDQNPSPENNESLKDQNSPSAGKAEQNPEPQEPPKTQLAQPQEGSISKDQADHWLSALDEDLKKFRQKQARKEKTGTHNQNRDW
ncbi:MAG: hypothetical protein NPINA01_14090 [Nitrospinaceae bacterium]|nr:MAG: hypothetical protein NPINA01_14090 [Nitrospinaceae bacterium]